ncbi:hypothetical protein ACWOCB_04775 [Gemella haemolysans]|uniref:Uncharacterized protein n=1 Tax=Gemella haemolysans ATCC 10379 TaxID=546270 RepID=C5NUN4_9BACL|nr:hypothetical protein [Gemella haemolysans]EER69052.1 hypothetical protein GEMHA0001_1260 [Gemella haemolysans ATCC 10379]KAA8708104.1 hypothetical protein F4V11_04900 [Gemella haemolysans]UBH82079.1 hypothetical protein LA340_07030 [Gemella haemolysans]VEI38003.1 Uncharacterised protein [Gemella haemolysans]
MELNEIIEDKKELTEVIKDIEDIIQRLASLHVSIQILATHCITIQTLSTDEYKNLKITEEELWKYWDKVRNGKNLHLLTEDFAIHSSKELSYLVYDALENVKEALQNINRVSNDIL